MAIDVMSYDPKKVNLSLAGRMITGFAADGILSVSKNEDSVTPSVGAKGDVTYSENANESGTVAITLMSTSSSLPYIRQLEAKRQKINVNISDANDSDSVHINEDNCRILKMPDISRVKAEGSVTINVYIPSLNVR